MKYGEVLDEVKRNILKSKKENHINSTEFVVTMFITPVIERLKSLQSAQCQKRFNSGKFTNVEKTGNLLILDFFKRRTISYLILTVKPKGLENKKR